MTMHTISNKTNRAVSIRINGKPTTVADSINVSELKLVDFGPFRKMFDITPVTDSAPEVPVRPLSGGAVIDAVKAANALVNKDENATPVMKASLGAIMSQFTKGKKTK